MDDSEKEPKNKSLLGAIVIFFYLVVCVIADIYVLSLNVDANQSASTFVCMARQYFTWFDWLFSRGLLSFVKEQCALSTVVEPTYSIIFFMLKLCLILVIMPFFWVFYLIDRKNIAYTFDLISYRLKHSKILDERIAAFKAFLFFLIADLLCFACNAFVADPTKYPIKYLHLKYLENLAGLLTFILIMGGISALFNTIVYYRLTTNKKNN